MVLAKDGWYIIILPLMLTWPTAVFAGILLAASLPGWRKVWGVLVGIGFPALLYLSLEIGLQYSPDAILRQNGRVVAEALNAYFADNGAYPKALGQLVPKYLVDLKEPKAIWGWLYTPTRNDFTLGYVYYIDKDGYSVCAYTAKSREWDCLPDSTGPFVLGPTPTSTLGP